MNRACLVSPEKTPKNPDSKEHTTVSSGYT